MLKNANDLSLEDVMDYIIKEFHIPTRKSLENIKELIQDIDDEDIKNFPKLQYLWELYIQFKSEYLKHMENEEIITFPTILKYEKIMNLWNRDMLKINDQHLNYVEMRNEHDIFTSYLLSIIELFEGLDLDRKIKKIQQEFLDIQEKNVEHADLENDIVYPKWAELQIKILWDKKSN